MIKRRLKELIGRNPVVAEGVDATLKKPMALPRIQAVSGSRRLLDAQAYRPSYWRVASDEINYRRFFDVNDLAALSTERAGVLEAMHRKIFDWVQAGWLDGLRIDHPDGLYDPKEYLDRLQIAARLVSARFLLEKNPGEYEGLDWTTAEPELRRQFAAEATNPLYVVIEKILAGGEQLPLEWATDGTTGYEFINLLNGLFVDPDGEAAMTRAYRELLALRSDSCQLVYSCKFQLLQSCLPAQLRM